MMRLVLTLGFALVVSAVASSASAQVQAARFSITVDGYEIASFSSIASLGSTSDVVEIIESTAGGGVVTRRLPGKLRYRDVTILRALSNDLGLVAWREQVENGDVQAVKTITIVGYNATGQPVMRYHLEHAWPSSIEVFTDKSTGALMESVTLVTDHIQRVSP